MTRPALLGLLLSACALAGAHAQDAPAATGTVEAQASEAEAASVREAIAKVGCEAATIEKESADLYEIDDATCAIGQYDIKLDGAFRIILMSSDGE